MKTKNLNEKIKSFGVEKEMPGRGDLSEKEKLIKLASEFKNESTFAAVEFGSSGSFGSSGPLYGTTGGIDGLYLDIFIYQCTSLEMTYLAPVKLHSWDLFFRLLSHWLRSKDCLPCLPDSWSHPALI